MNTLLDTAELSEAAKHNIEKWLSEPKYSFYKEEVVGLIRSNEWKALEDAFFQVLPFGTGGRRGTCGVGSNRVNRVTVGETVQALCDYLKQLGKQDARVGIAFDSRLTSEDFAQYCARVLAGNDIQSYIFDGPRATPELSFTVRDMKLDAGIVITASHNPSGDNGIKLYWSDGGQLVAPHDKNILECAANVTEVLESEDQKSERIVTIGKKEDAKYWDAAGSHLQGTNRELKIAYSPLHGTGITSVKPVLERAGFEVLVYEPQASMDGNFPNVTNNIPNPEVTAANDKIALFAVENNCDIATTNDPDADRFCVLVNTGGGIVQLNGNQAAVLMTDYILQGMQERGELTPKHFISSTIVTTDMLLKIAEYYGISTASNLLVGFKYIGEQIHLRHDNGDEIFVCGGEESYGGIVGDYCRDKDAAGPTAVVAELAAELKKEGKTLLDKLDELYTRYGFFSEDLRSIMFPGAQGFSAMQKFMQEIRTNPPVRLAGSPVVRVRDYSTGTEIEGVPGNVVRIELSEDGHNRVTIRPSGTEPKIKVYIQLQAPVDDDNSLETARAVAAERTEAIENDVLAMISADKKS